MTLQVTVGTLQDQNYENLKKIRKDGLQSTLYSSDNLLENFRSIDYVIQRAFTVHIFWPQNTY